MMKKGISVKDKMDSFHLSFETKELTEGVSNDFIDNPKASVYSNGKRAWFQDHKPDVIKQIDSQLRKRFDIGDNKVSVCLYYPPERDSNKNFKEKKLIIKDGNQNVFSRVIVSTISETTNISYGKMSGESIELRPWVAYKSPPMIGGMLTYTFDNSSSVVIPAKKGFRQVRKSKKIDSRHVLVFDYMVSTNDMNQIAQALSGGKGEDKQTLTPEEMSSLKEAMDKLK